MINAEERTLTVSPCVAVYELTQIYSYRGSADLTPFFCKTVFPSKRTNYSVVSQYFRPVQNREKMGPKSRKTFVPVK